MVNKVPFLGFREGDRPNHLLDLPLPDVAIIILFIL